MKLLFASDIHGSAKYCEALLTACKQVRPDKIILLGDLLYHGPRNDLPMDYDTRRTMQILNSLKSRIIAVRGNCEAEVDQMVLEFPCMNSYELLEFDGLRFFATHGHQYNPQNLPPFVQFDVLLNGHTHIHKLVDYGDYFFANPGSISIPKGGTAHSCMIYEDHRLTIHNLLNGEEIDAMEIHRIQPSAPEKKSQ